MNRIRFVAALSTLPFALGFAGAAWADDPGAGNSKGVYISIQGGETYVDDTDIQAYDVDGGLGLGTNGSQDTLDTTYGLKPTTSINGAIGYDFGRVRADIEVGYARSTIDSITVNQVNGAAVTLTAGNAASLCSYAGLGGCTLNAGNTITFTSGPKLRQLSVMGNVWLDLPIGGGTIEPYVGGGVGALGFEIDGEGKGKFAWQLGGGVAFKLSDGFALTADARYRQVGGVDVPYDSVSGYRTGKISTTLIGLGLRLRF